MDFVKWFDRDQLVMMDFEPRLYKTDRKHLQPKQNRQSPGIY